MVGLATRLVIAERVRTQLPVADRVAIDHHPQWYLLGALGPAIGDFVPSDQATTLGGVGRTPYWAVWKEVLKIAVGDTAGGIPGVVPVLRSMKVLLDSVDQAVNDEDVGALKDIVDSGAQATLDQAGADLTLILQQFSDPLRFRLLGQLMGSSSRPRIDDPNNLVPPGLWTGRDWLHWRSTGTFVAALRQRADASGDERLIAYSRGWQVTYAALTAASGFVNSAVGSVYRTHWWRHRWVSNFVDAWVWGYYDVGASMAGDIPTPPFADWTGVCSANLQDLVNVSGGGIDHEANAKAIADEASLPHLLPTDFTGYWLAAFEDAYGAAGVPPFSDDTLQKGYVALVTVLWFQSSGDVIGCNPLPGSPPGACGSGGPHDWVNPTQTNPATGKPFLPHPPSPEADPDVAEIVSGIVLSLLGIVACAFGGWAVGAGALVGGIVLIVDGAKQPDWDDLKCDVYWLKVYLFNGLTALHNLTVFGGVQHPYGRDLAVDQLVLSFGNDSLPYTSGAAVVKSKGVDGLRRPWGGTLSTWTSPPTEPSESQLTDVWGRPGLWPSALVDDAAANPLDIAVADPPGPWPGGAKGYFGPAVQAALLLYADDRRDLPSWNLDADRGRGWLTWQLRAPYAVPVAPVPEP